MAQGSVVGVAVAEKGGSIQDGAGGAAGSLLTSLRPEELHEVQEYEKLLRFRDQIISGLHPSIKPPAHSLGKVAQVSKPPPTGPAALISASSASSAKHASANTGVNGKRPEINNLQAHQANLQKPPVNMTNLPGLGALPNKLARPLDVNKPIINPVLLEKSDDLVKAEIRIQRQRLERVLQEQLEQSLSASKISEQLAELDVSDILAKALTLPEDVPAQSTDDVAANASASSDSFDDNTFYSSQHGTPESQQMAHRLPTESDNEEMRDGSPYEPQFDPEPVAQMQPPAMPAQAIPGVSTYQHHQKAHEKPRASAPAANVSVPAPVVVPGLSFGATNASGTFGQRPVNERLLSQTMGRQQPSPLVRSHDLSPLAPQPERVSPLAPLALTRQQHLAGSDASGRRATPAQVAALRKQNSNASSPESSPQGNNNKAEKKKKKKRKADRLAAETSATAASPYIKPEPRSPSPLTAPPYARPSKRQRQSLHQSSAAFPYGETRYEQQPDRADDGYQERFPPRAVRQERVVGYERAGEYRPRHDDEPILITSPRYERVYIDDSRPPVSGPPPHLDSPGAPSGQYLTREVRTVRDVSRVVDGPYDVAGAPYYRDVRAASRMGGQYPERSSSPVMYERSTMPPPRAQPRRIIIDEQGREYYEPVPQSAVVREEIISDPRVAPSERFIERIVPSRAMSRRPEFMEDEVIYQSASPVYGGQRRVVTQPQFAAPGPRAYREAGPPGNSMPPPPSEYTPSRPRLDGGFPSEVPREYIARSASVRPPVEPVRYEAPSTYERIPVDDRSREYFGGIRSASVRPAAEGVRYEMPIAYERRVGGAVEEYIPLRSASVRPLERYEPLAGDYGGGRPQYGAPPVYQDIRRDTMQPPPPPPPSAGGRGGYMREDDDVVFLDRRPMR
ncbi:hypothetical protein QBC35DRAFT_422342 [Podospora australis]|uniref:Uncharacterized protein n=1 Tax=Podospora australis TaxID=1536484 RepID=A0AAN7AQH4_9PEZI|nr:hypothetical protein QBC35DRAFT_422342 [Podospora australis]